jgi:fatty acid desaturase
MKEGMKEGLLIRVFLVVVAVAIAAAVFPLLTFGNIPQSIFGIFAVWVLTNKLASELGL